MGHTCCLELSLPVYIGSANQMNKLSLMLLPEKYKEKGLRSKRRNSPYIFQVVASLPTKACSYLLSSFFSERLWLQSTYI
jgi:hypothetical protein